jgi:group I intron endonuclease
MYIYKFTHAESGRCYIGQTIQLPVKRKWEHICDTRDSEKTYHFHNALKKYGVESFIFEVIDSASSLEELNRLEEFYINKFDSIQNGFNIRQGGNNKIHNAESIKRMSESQKAAHARRRAEGRDGGWIRRDGGAMKGKSHPNKGGTSLNKGKKKGLTWEQIYGVEGAAIRRQKLKERPLRSRGG